MTIAKLMSGVGRALLVFGLAGAGALCLRYGGLDPQWQHPPRDWNSAPLAYANGAILIVLSLTLLVPRVTRAASYALTAFLVLWVPAFAAPRVIAGEEAAWLAPAEVLFVAGGAWIAGACERGRRAALVMFGLC